MEKIFDQDRMTKRERVEATLNHQPVNRGTPEEVRAEVRRRIIETDALRTGGMLVGSSSEINPAIKSENFAVMVEAVGELRNPQFAGERLHE